MNLIEHFINGKIVPGVSERKGKVFNPAIGKQESEVRLASAKDLHLAAVSYTHLRAHETPEHLGCRLRL